MEQTPDNARQQLLAKKIIWREHLRRSKQTPNEHPLHVGIAATFTVDPLVPYLGSALIEAGVHPRISIGEYNQIFQACLNLSTFWDETPPEILCFLWRIEDMAEQELSEFAGGAQDASDRIEAKLFQFAAALRTLRDQFTGTIVVAIPPYPQLFIMHPSDLSAPMTFSPMIRRLQNTWVRELSKISGVRLLDLDALQRDFGMEKSFDSRKWYLYKQPYSEAYLDVVGEQLGRIIVALHTAPLKCIACDCDNTLWGGIVGEDGVSRIILGDEYPGQAFVDLQRLLLHWKNQGVFLALLSKNNEQDVWEVFDKHDGMILQRDDIAAWRINWEPKPQNLREIADELNISTDSIVFIDDSPFEVEHMKRSLPDVVSVTIPEEPSAMVGHLQNLHLFEEFQRTQEDRQRTVMAIQEKERVTLSEKLSHEDFIRSLNLEVELFQPTENQVGRVAQLINKTNQFNLTTIRRSEDEIIELIASDRYKVYAARIKDSFGDYGLTSVAILEKNRDTWRIETFLMSCRVLGRSVETAILSTLLDMMSSAGAKHVVGWFVPTAKNMLVKDFYDHHGFSVGEDEGCWIRKSPLGIPPPEGIRIEISR